MNRYPKPGSPNPTVTVHLFSLEGQSTRKLHWEEAMHVSKRIIAEVSWLGPQDLLVKEVDRSAKKGNVVLFTGGQARGSVVRTLGKDGEEGDDGWIDHVCSALYCDPNNFSDTSPGLFTESTSHPSQGNQRLLGYRTHQGWIQPHCLFPYA
jgi:hypothetical protein